MSKPQRRLSLKNELKRLKKQLETKFKTKLKLYKKHPEVWIGDRIADMAKNIGVTDVAKIIAIVGMTILVKKTIDKSEQIRGQLKALGIGPRFRIGPVNPFERVNPQLLAVFGAVKPEQFEGMFPDWMDWLISFTLAFIIVEHFGSIMHATGNILTSVKGLVSALLLGGGTVG